MREAPDNARVQAAPRHVAAPPEFDAEGLPVQDENGVDLTLIRAMLRLPPSERVRQAEASVVALACNRPVPDSVSNASDLRGVLEVLTRHGVDFVVVGGLAGALHGSRGAARDVDIVHARNDRNIKSLLAALHELQATFRNDSRGLAPNESDLRGPGHHLLWTSLGPLDVLGSMGPGLEYPQLSSDAAPFDLGGIRVRALSLDRLIAIKQTLDRPKDKVHLLQFLALRAERERPR